MILGVMLSQFPVKPTIVNADGKIIDFAVYLLPFDLPFSI